ncbi:uncharacterized protein FYW61_013303 isoform 2-T2 [Anableps anableps]
MEGKETEMSKEELQSWIREEVHKARLSNAGVAKKYRLLQSILERRQRRVTRFLELCQSVMVFENTVKELYSQLGWEYPDFDSDSDSGDEPMSCRRTLPFLFVSSGDRSHRPSASRDSTSQSPVSEVEENQEEIISQKSRGVVLDKEALVILTKLSSSQIAAAMPPPSPDADNAKDEDFSSAESDMQWEPDEEISESDCSVSDFSTGLNKKRKINKNEQKHPKVNPAAKRRRKFAQMTRKARRAVTSAKKNSNNTYSVTETLSLTATSDSDDESSKQDAAALLSNSKTIRCLFSGTKNTSQTSGTITTKTQVKTTKTRTQSSTTNSTAETTIMQSTTLSKTVSAESNVEKTLTPSADTKKTAASQQSSKTTNAPPSVPKGEIKLNMYVLARKKYLCWQRGKVAEIITKDGKVKYKITFEEKGKILVSGHHLAFDSMPKLEDLSIGCRVVVKCSSENVEYKPGIMAELPSRKNRMRFLVYIDDHTPMYVGLPALHLVYRPLENPLDDIPDQIHREFMREYLRVWPYPPQTQYKVGQTIKADYEGVMQKCEVIMVDCSLVEVIFESDKHKEWIYRGSLRLEHMINMKHCMWKKEAEESTKKP